MSQITPRDIAEADQTFTLIVDHVCPHWRSMFLRLVAEGFAEPQAMVLLKAYIQKPGA